MRSVCLGKIFKYFVFGTEGFVFPSETLRVPKSRRDFETLDVDVRLGSIYFVKDVFFRGTYGGSK